MKQYILTYFGTILSLKNDILHQTPLRDIQTVKQCVSITESNLREAIIKHDNPSLSPTNEKNSICNDLFQIDFLSHHIITLRKGDFYLCSQPEYSFSTPSDSLSLRTEQGEWEMFRLIPKKHLKKLIFLQRNGFLLHGIHYSFKNNTLNHMTFISDKMDEKTIPYENFFSSFSRKDLTFTFFQDEYPYFAKIYSPCVLYTIFGSGNIQEQFTISLTSLIKIGKYRGHIIIVTDNESYFIDNIMSLLGFYSYSIIHKAASDRTDMINMRLDVLKDPSMVNPFQPFFYIDCDILIVNDINPLLKDAPYHKAPSAQIETSNTLKDSPSTGGTLYQASPFPSDDVHGFNSGILMIPSGPQYRDLFHTAYIMATRHALEHGRESVPFFDQSILNYVLYKSGNFSDEPITSVTVLDPDDMTERTLFIHFWSYGHQRTDVMRETLTQLEGEKAQ